MIYDDIDIPTGTIRIRKKAVPERITACAISSICWEMMGFRARVGIGATDGKQRDLINYVIGGVSKADVETIEEVDACAGAVCIVEKGIDKAMNA